MFVCVRERERETKKEKEKKTDRDSRIKSESYRDRKIESKLQ